MPRDARLGGSEPWEFSSLGVPKDCSAWAAQSASAHWRPRRLIITRKYNLIVPSDKGTHNFLARALAQEPDRAITEGDVRPAGVESVDAVPLVVGAVDHARPVSELARSEERRV